MEEPREGFGKLSVYQLELLKKELLGFKEQLQHLQVSVFAENQSVCIGSFDLQARIGKGGYSSVYRAVDKYTKSVFAIKVIRKLLVLHKNAIGHLKKEASILRSLNSEYSGVTSFIVNLRHSFQDRENVYMVFDHMPGSDLQYHLSKQSKFSEEQTRTFS